VRQFDVLKRISQRLGNNKGRDGADSEERGAHSAETEPAMDEERRKASRHRTLKSGKIVVHAHTSVIDCTVRNLSPKGALLVVSSLAGIPDKFDLSIGTEQYQCRVIWRGENRLGVEFD
jgi:hypothetical protein